MNNNGVNQNTINSNGSNASQSTLAPMAGVTVAPPNEQPVNASTTGRADNVVGATNVNIQPQPQTMQTSQSVITSIPQSVQQPAVQPQTPNLIPAQQPVGVVTTPTQNITADTNTVQKKKKGISIVPILLLIIAGLGFYLYYSNKSFKAKMDQMSYNCTPITASKNEVKLDLNSTLVKDLYKRVATNIREDIAQPEFNDNMKLYLAYRQIVDSDKYDSNCNMFSATSMEPYTCEVSTNFVPKAFKAEALILAIKKMYGENTELSLNNIQLGSSCIVGYQYIPERDNGNGEFVQGICGQQNATSFKVDKKLTKAVSTGNTIILTEDVKYHENEKLPLPDSLKSGIYYYTFRLDMNYNYVLVDKTYESKY